MQRSELLQAIYDNWGPLKRSMHSYFSAHFGELHLSPAQLEVVKTIHSEQPLSHKALAKKLQLTPGAITQLLEGLEEAGLIVRTTDPADRRVVLLSLTPLGEDKIEAFKQLGKQLLRDVFTKLEDEELAVYLQTQRKLIERLEAEQPNHKHKEE